MAKPKTKGAPIQIRLPVKLDALLRSHAAARKETPAAFVENVVAASAGEGWVYPIGTPESARRLVITGEAAKRSAKAVASVKANPEKFTTDPACTHPKAKIYTVGALKRCDACGMVRGVDGEWR